MHRNEISSHGFLLFHGFHGFPIVLASLRELVLHARRALLTLTHNAGVKLGAVPSTDSDFENGGSTSKSANTTKPMDVACNDWAWLNSLHFGALTLASQQMAKSVANGYFGPHISSNWFSHPCASSTDGRQCGRSDIHGRRHISRQHGSV